MTRSLPEDDVALFACPRCGALSETEHPICPWCFLPRLQAALSRVFDRRAECRAKGLDSQEQTCHGRRVFRQVA